MTTQPLEFLACPAVARSVGIARCWRIWLTVLLAAGAFHLAYAAPQSGFLMVFYGMALLYLASAPTWRWAFYPGLVVGLLIAAVRLAFFWEIFSGGAIGLWLVYAFWIGLFVALARQSLTRLPGGWGFLLIPFLWCGLEYFRSELYYLRFSWLSPGFAFGGRPGVVPFYCLGVYGMGFFFMALASASVWAWRKSNLLAIAIVLVGLALPRLAPLAHRSAAAGRAVPIRVAGVQMEFPTESDVIFHLTQLVRQHPEADLLVLSEYTFSEAIPSSITNWCRKHARYLVVGGKDPTTSSNFYDTAFVISPKGETVFRQAKAIPIQFFRDGLPAPQQTLWRSPWGPLGICICYDLSYSRVTDRLIRQGAEALIVPTMDIADWGKAQHELHARVAPIRAAEYGVPIFRVASSGISQAVDREGRVRATAPFPGDGAILSNTIELRGPGHLPWDRYWTPISAALTGLFILALLVEWVSDRKLGLHSKLTAASPGA